MKKNIPLLFIAMVSFFCGYMVLYGNPFVIIKKKIAEKKPHVADEDMVHAFVEAQRLTVELIDIYASNIQKTVEKQKDMGALINTYLKDGSFGTDSERYDMFQSIQLNIKECKEKIIQYQSVAR